ncbi:type 1 glutamine amidotransferase [Oceanobacter mangrovi]|uniref:type 1 glutamine amidotransferase n=1 Tax=Oceanobacter mangrovi TaxID=2862510 RepID=UPI001C8E0D69|nr:type 1 glutamine amidotransferase [Oceanobacter mangrovi]
MKIGILATGITPDEMIPQYGSYADMFVRLFAPLNPGFDYQVYDVRLGTFPEAADECDGWIITGSKFSVYEDIDWIHQLKEFTRAIGASRKPLVGICFGHQLMAEAFGGKVEKYTGGWGVGVHQYQVHGALADKLSGQIRVNAVHQDQVSILPAGAEVVASSEFCRYAGLSYDGGRMVSLQPHPEFTLKFEEDLLKFRGGDGIPMDAAAPGIETATAPNACVDSPVIAEWLLSVLQGSY